jgi:hypothetical protein
MKESASDLVGGGGRQKSVPQWRRMAVRGAARQFPDDPGTGSSEDCHGWGSCRMTWCLLVARSAGWSDYSISPSVQLAAEESRNSVRRWALVAAGLLITIWPAITAKPRAAHHLLREREDVFRQFGVEVSRLPGRDGKVPGVGEKITCAQLEECGAWNVSDG